MLYKTRFPIPILQYLFYLSELGLHPVYWSVNTFLAPFFVTTLENHWSIDIVLKRVIYVPLLLVFLVIFGIPVVLGCILRCLLHLCKRPYVLSVDKSFIPPSINERRSSFSVSRNKRNSHQFSKLNLEKIYTVSSANVCLLPEILSRFNNLPNSAKRSFAIGERIVVDQFFFQNSMNTIMSPPKTWRRNSKTEKNRSAQSPGHNILTHFPRLDFLCLQETWDRNYSHKLMSELHKVFPWILYDVGISNYSINRFMFNSGLMFASRYEILDANFLPFSDSVSQCLYNSKGLLMAKVLLSSTEQHDNVGYIFSTHLQAYQGMNTTLQRQLDEILNWTKLFRQETMKSSDIILFDVLCGDFNFDNLSPVDVSCTRHEIFNVYEDVCRVKPGQDQDWTVGTEMRQMCMWEDQVSTPAGLKDALEDPILRHRYLIDANIKEGTMNEIVTAKPLQEEEVKMNLKELAGRRRIDYILYRKDKSLVSYW